MCRCIESYRSAVGNRQTKAASDTQRPRGASAARRPRTEPCRSAPAPPRGSRMWSPQVPRPFGSEHHLMGQTLRRSRERVSPFSRACDGLGQGPSLLPWLQPVRISEEKAKQPCRQAVTAPARLVHHRGSATCKGESPEYSRLRIHLTLRAARPPSNGCDAAAESILVRLDIRSPSRAINLPRLRRPRPMIW
jgi:hypothetical protein